MADAKPVEKLSPEARSTIKIIFLTLFLDLVGFSIIFPLFPQMIDYYTRQDPNNFFMAAILKAMHTIMIWGGVTDTTSSIVLFGGILGALYSLLQFMFSPFWGSLSDRIGRRPVLLISVTGTALSYVLWFFSGSFGILLFARVVGGLMSGNISTATAVIGDITTEKTRSRGMAFIGIAFGLGFIFGPAIGGISSLLHIETLYPQLVPLGVNPFSAPAAIAFVLALINVLWIAKKFKETLPKDKRAEAHSQRTANVFALFKPTPVREINYTNLTNFFFLTAFSGMEFTLTFLALERLSYTSMKNAYMFIYIGVLIALVQGGFVRRKAQQIGERRMALLGLLLLIPGLLILSTMKTVAVLYIALTFLAFGAAMVIPCLTSLVSLFATSQTQGQAIGTFRSLGALARAVGPFIASLLYWRLGSSLVYVIGSAMLLLPIALTFQLPNPTHSEVV